MRHIAIQLKVGAVAALAAFGPAPFSHQLITTKVDAQTRPAATAATPAEQSVQDYTQARLQADLAAVQTFRPSYPFWRHIFTIPDGRIIFGSAPERTLAGDFSSARGLGAPRCLGGSRAGQRPC